MIRAQEYINQKYPTKEDLKELDISGWNDKDGKWEVKSNWEKLTGELDLSDFPNLEKLDCSYNQITSLNLTNCPNLTELKCWENELTEIKFFTLSNLKVFYAWTNYLTEIDWEAFNPQNLTNVSISNNNLKKQDLKVFSQFTNLEELYLGNDTEERLENKVYNRFYGSLKHLKNLTNLKKLQIEETDIEEGFEHLPKDLQVITSSRRVIIRELSLSGEEREELLKTKSKDEFKKVLNEIVINYAKKQLGFDLTLEQKQQIEELSDAIVGSSFEELRKQIKRVQELILEISKIARDSLKKVFLGGTCNNSTWREELIPLLDSTSYFNPVVAELTPETQQEEARQKASCDFLLCTITKEMLGFYAIVEVVEDSNKSPDRTIFCYLEEGFNKHQIKSLQAIARLVEGNGALVFTSLEEIAEYLNSQQLEAKIEIPPKKSN